MVLKFKSLAILASKALMTSAFALFLQTIPTQTLNANGDNRTIALYHTHNKASINITYMRGGEYDSDALKKLNWFLRDWRSDEPTNMDPRLFDIVWFVQRQLGTGQPFYVVSAYRSPATNAMLRRRSKGVAKHSQHMRGKAMDFYVPGASMSKVREIGLKLQRGGVGYYPSAHNPFVHLDAGSVRHWPKMPRYQLARIFPDGKTVHIPSDGQPMERYDEALAEIEKYGGSTNVAYAPSKGSGKSFWAKLFSSNDDEDDEEEAKPVRTRSKSSQKTTAIASADTSDLDLDSKEPVALAPKMAQIEEPRQIIPSATELRNIPKPELSPNKQVASIEPIPSNAPSPLKKPIELASTPQDPKMLWQKGPDAIVTTTAAYKPSNAPIPSPSPFASKVQVASLEPKTSAPTSNLKVANVPVPSLPPRQKPVIATLDPKTQPKKLEVASTPSPKIAAKNLADAVPQANSAPTSGKGDRQDTIKTASIPNHYDPKSAFNLISEAHNTSSTKSNTNNAASAALLKAGNRFGPANGFEQYTGETQNKKFQ